MEEWSIAIEVVVKFSIVFIVLLLILLIGITLQPRDWWWWKLGHTTKRRKKKKKSKLITGNTFEVEATPVLHHNYEEVKPLPITPPPTVTSRTVHSPCMGCKLLNAKRGCSYNCCAICCRGNKNSICRVHGTGYHACVLAVQAAISLQYSLFDISYAHLKQCPPGIPNIGPQLVTLNVSNNRLVTLPSDIGQLTNLMELFAQYNCLSSLPDSVCNLRNLMELDVKNNALTNIPDNIGNLRRLVTLNLTNNLILQLPKSIGKLTHLEECSLHSNRLTELPDEFCNVTRLKTLYAGENTLHTLPHRFGRLVRLEELDLSSCDLLTLPESLASCTSLTRLWLSNNRLSTLPYGIGNLKQLKELHVRNNKIKCFPASIEKLDPYTFSAHNNTFLTEREAPSYTFIPRDCVPPLLELASRAVIMRRVSWSEGCIPVHLTDKLSHPFFCSTCSQPLFGHMITFIVFKTIGVFYRLPLCQNYCSVHCKNSQSL